MPSWSHALSVVTWALLSIGCGSALQQEPTTPLDPEVLATATDLGARYRLWPVDTRWTGWTFGTAAVVECGGAQHYAGEVFSGCTDGSTIILLASLDAPSTLAALLHELMHARAGQPDHCDWSLETGLVDALKATGGSAGDFLDACTGIQCTFRGDASVCE